MGRTPVLYDVYSNGMYLGRCTQKEITEKYGIQKNTVYRLASTGGTNKDGYEVINAEIPGFQETWRKCCERLKPSRMKGGDQYVHDRGK